MELYKERGVNPASGCLPILLQLPLLLIIYQVISQGLTNPDPTAMFTVFGVKVLDVQCVNGLGTAAYDAYKPCIDTTVGWLGNMDVSRPQVLFGLPFIGGFSLLAFISAFLQLVQSRMTMPPSDPAYQDQNSRVQRQLRPVPAAHLDPLRRLPPRRPLHLYWIVTTVFGIAEQYLIVGWGFDVPDLRLDARVRPGPPAALPRPGADAPIRAPRREARGSQPIHAPPPAPRPAAPHPRRPPSARANEAARAAEGESADTMSEYRESTGKSVEEAYAAPARRSGSASTSSTSRSSRPAAGASWAWAPSPPGSWPRRAARSAARLPSAPRQRRRRCRPPAARIVASATIGPRAAMTAAPAATIGPRGSTIGPARPRAPEDPPAPRRPTRPARPPAARDRDDRPPRREDRGPRRDDRPPRRDAPRARRRRPSRRPRRRWSRSPARDPRARGAPGGRGVARPPSTPARPSSSS